MFLLLIISLLLKNFNHFIYILTFVRYYKTATKLDESSVIALSGIIACQLKEKQFEIAKEQLDFLKEIQNTVTNRSEILYMSAILGRQTGVPSDQVSKKYICNLFIKI